MLRVSREQLDEDLHISMKVQRVPSSVRVQYRTQNTTTSSWKNPRGAAVKFKIRPANANSGPLFAEECTSSAASRWSSQGAHRRGSAAVSSFTPHRSPLRSRRATRGTERQSLNREGASRTRRRGATVVIQSVQCIGDLREKARRGGRTPVAHQVQRAVDSA